MSSLYIALALATYIVYSKFWPVLLHEILHEDYDSKRF